MKKKVLIVFGTRPEAIKMAPLVKMFQTWSNSFETSVCVTAQHREMLDQVLKFFEINANYDLNVMKKDQDLNSLTADIIVKMKAVLQQLKPDYVFVHGDTTTSTIAALAAFYEKIKVCHVESGLRTYDKYSPFPEEINRQITARIADIHFAPTALSKNNLLQEGIANEKVHITGNTVIDALLIATEKLRNYEDKEIAYLKTILLPNKKIILVTGHRRENFGDGFINICKAIKELSEEPDVQIIYPVHLNPNVKGPVYEILSEAKNTNLIAPLSYPAFTWLMQQSYIILTDSGGVQEEAPGLGKPVLVMRDTTERPEAIDAGTVKLVGANKDTILAEAKKLLNDSTEYKTMSNAHNPYGDGYASQRIINILLEQKN